MNVHQKRIDMLVEEAEGLSGDIGDLLFEVKALEKRIQESLDEAECEMYKVICALRRAKEYCEEVV